MKAQLDSFLPPGVSALAGQGVRVGARESRARDGSAQGFPARAQGREGRETHSLPYHPWVSLDNSGLIIDLQFRSLNLQPLNSLKFSRKTRTEVRARAAKPQRKAPTTLGGRACRAQRRTPTFARPSSRRLFFFRARGPRSGAFSFSVREARPRASAFVFSVREWLERAVSTRARAWGRPAFWERG